MFNENDVFYVETDNGKEKFYKLATFYNTDTNKNYIIYTDGKNTDDNKIAFYGSILSKEDKIIPLENDIDIEIVNDFIMNLK